MTLVDKRDGFHVVTPQALVGDDSAAGTEWSQTVPDGELWLIRAVTVVLVQGITQTPLPVLQIDDGGNVIFESPGSSVAQAVSTTCRYTWAPGNPLSGQVGSTTGVRSVAPLPFDLVLPAGYRLRSSTPGIGANSDYGRPIFYAEKLPA